ncbi:hypothetical protein OG535_03800 [Kitasatospora sp. NBC_00085]|uniref:hypothetical protein n=1 Tax=unclassified Kitasatospora TaxID=2633591 RepID=UPI003248322A
MRKRFAPATAGGVFPGVGGNGCTDTAWSLTGGTAVTPWDCHGGATREWRP